MHAAHDWTLLGVPPSASQPASQEAFVRTGLLHKASLAIRCEVGYSVFENVRMILEKRPAAVLDM